MINYVENFVTSEKCYLPNILLAVARIEVRQKLDPILWCFIASWSHIRQFAAIFNRISNLGQCASPGQVRKAPAPALPLGVDVSHNKLPLPAHNQLGVVLEVVHLGEREVESFVL